jgi:subtilisin family serine protease
LDKHGDGSTTGLLKALSWVSANSTPGKSIINLSLSGPKSKLVEQAIEQTSRDRNIPMIVSAGNTGDDACKYLPAASSYAFAVGATDSTDTIAYYSAIGKCVRMYAPGTNILSAWSTSDTATMVLDGTSMANPHVSGIASILLAQKSYSNVQELYGDLVATGTKNILTPSNMQSQNNLTVDNVLAFAPAAR